jgi:hypothetical protein
MAAASERFSLSQMHCKPPWQRIFREQTCSVGPRKELEAAIDHAREVTRWS